MYVLNTIIIFVANLECYSVDIGQQMADIQASLREIVSSWNSIYQNA